MELLKHNRPPPSRPLAGSCVKLTTQGWLIPGHRYQEPARFCSTSWLGINVLALCSSGISDRSRRWSTYSEVPAEPQWTYGLFVGSYTWSLELQEL